MKKIATLLILLLSFSASMYADDDLTAFISDNTGTATNIRTAPNGKVAFTLPHTTSYIVDLESPRKGWWKVIEIEDAENASDVKMHGSKTGYWIHYTMVGLGTRNYGGQTLSLRAKPNAKSKRVYSFSTEMVLHPIEVKGDWVKVVTPDGKHTGWIYDEHLCSNPLTNCC